MIPVTKSFVPPIEEYSKIVNRAFEKGWLTNRGELVLELEEKLNHYLDVSSILVMNNGTIPLQIALKLLGDKGEIITTPFSYVATTSSIVWENCTPVFVDIDPDHLTIDESKIEAAITSNTTAILATHVFGNMCDVDTIEKIAKKHNIKVIYDAAHSFGVKYQGKSAFEYGDVSTCSFHATKLFHTGEGGAIFCNEKELFDKIYYSHNFGHNGSLDFFGLGINGKISELNAAMGLTVLPYIPQIIEDRKRIVERYSTELNWNELTSMKIRKNTEWNYSYFPVVFTSEAKLIEVEKNLNENGVFPRRYFYPSLNTLEYVNSPVMNHAEDIAARVLCLPLYSGLLEPEVDRIIHLINDNLC
ncbi:MAG: DegT/DnrJ/EryC1/StrS family aminotransferase [Crocinitomicaceae bacterium]|nr:DegT/DnrJ/EryC1/StrS family aminotransferase [Crocinitomicaceae bacterium]